MFDTWLDFGAVLVVQLAVFIVFAIYQKKLADVPKILAHGILLGVIVGLLYDFTFGKYLGLFSYALGFGASFLMINAALSYGLFAASALLLGRVHTLHFVIWLSVLLLVYETTNHFFRAWTYEFSLPLVPLFVLLLVGYSSGAVLVSAIASVLFQRQFIMKIEHAKRQSSS